MKKKMLLHSCCGPCSTAVINVLKDDYDLTVFYYNPNIDPDEEYRHRLSEQQRYVKDANLGIVVIDGTLDDKSRFYKAFEGLENCQEGGARCAKCIQMRLEKTAEFAKNNSFEIFATTLTVSPHKNAPLINGLGKDLSKKYNIDYLDADFKKKNGFLNSIKFAKQYNLYRQNYCGCKFSIHN